MSNDLDERRDEAFFTPGVIGAIVVAIVLAIGLFMWAPWSGSQVATNSAPGVTTGQSSSVPRAPQPLPAPGK